METIQGRARVNHPYLNSEGCDCIIARVQKGEQSWMEVASWKRETPEEIEQDLDHRVRGEGARITRILDRGKIIVDYENRKMNVQGLNGTKGSVKEILQKAYSNYTIITE